MKLDNSTVISKIAEKLLENDRQTARRIIHDEYPHSPTVNKKRSYTLRQKMSLFMRDGFIDRYTGKRLINPGMLKIISHYFPEDFPYQAHWKMTDTHIAYWELTPTLDHIYPIAKGGEDDEHNWVTTSMKNNSIKSNYAIDELQWELHPKGNLTEWDGLTSVFLTLVEKNTALLEDDYIKNWYVVSKKAFSCIESRD